MRRQFRRRSAGHPVSANTICLAVLGLCFCMSGAAGCFYASLSGGDGAASFSAFLEKWISCESMVLPGFLPVLLEFFLPPAILFVSGFSFLGVIAVPALTAARAFFLSYAVSVFYRTCGMSGLTASAGVFALHILVSVPVLFAVGSAALSASFCRFSSRREAAAHLFERTLSSSACAALLVPTALLQWSVMPRIFRTACEILIKLI